LNAVVSLTEEFRLNDEPFTAETSLVHVPASVAGVDILICARLLFVSPLIEKNRVVVFDLSGCLV
jgi:hypothetical protein